MKLFFLIIVVIFVFYEYELLVILLIGKLICLDYFYKLWVFIYVIVLYGFFWLIWKNIFYYKGGLWSDYLDLYSIF